jgi:hypothetical protein
MSNVGRFCMLLMLVLDVFAISGGLLRSSVFGLVLCIDEVMFCNIFHKAKPYVFLLYQVMLTLRTRFRSNSTIMILRQLHNNFPFITFNQPLKNRLVDDVVYFFLITDIFTDNRGQNIKDRCTLLRKRKIL